MNKHTHTQTVGVMKRWEQNLDTFNGTIFLLFCLAKIQILHQQQHMTSSIHICQIKQEYKLISGIQYATLENRNKVHPQRTFPRRTFPRGTFPRRTFPQRTFPQGTFPQGTFPQRTFPQRTFPRRTLCSKESHTSTCTINLGILKTVFDTKKKKTGGSL